MALNTQTVGAWAGLPTLRGLSTSDSNTLSSDSAEWMYLGGSCFNPSFTFFTFGGWSLCWSCTGLSRRGASFVLLRWGLKEPPDWLRVTS
eukprot:447158-Hanusia_phi.AAC.4